MWSTYSIVISRRPNVWYDNCKAQLKINLLHDRHVKHAPSNKLPWRSSNLHKAVGAHCWHLFPPLSQNKDLQQWAVTSVQNYANILVLVNHHSYTVPQQSTGSFRHCSPIFTATIDVIMELWGDWQSVSLLGGIMKAWDDGQCVSLGGIIWAKIPLPSVSLSSPPGVQWWKGFGLQVIISPARPQVKGPTLTGPGRVELLHHCPWAHLTSMVQWNA